MRNFSVAGLGAITAGLTLLLSENVSEEFSFGEKLSYFTLEKNRWVDSLLSKPMNLQRDKAYKDVIEKAVIQNNKEKLEMMKYTPLYL